jgi:hypothetical protein
MARVDAVWEADRRHDSRDFEIASRKSTCPIGNVGGVPFGLLSPHF